jgi:hypothetical protein
MISRLSLTTLALLLPLLLGGCDDSSNQTTPTKSEAQLLREQFGASAEFFTQEGMQGLLDFADTGSPVTLLQLMSVSDAERFAEYEAEAETVWQSVGAQTSFASSILAQLIGERGLVEVRAIAFPNITMLLDAMNTDAFTVVMDTLYAASDDHAWVLGVEQILPFEPGGSYFDPALRNIDEQRAQSLFDANREASRFEPNTQVILDMIVSDDPSPFWMVNLIDFFDQAHYEDGRDTDLTGQEANEIYGQAIFPTLLAHNSLPELIMPVAVVLTRDDIEWEQAAIVRYASRDAFLNSFPLNPHASAAVEHKEAGVENTLVYVSEVASENLPTPMDGFLYGFRYCEVLLANFEGERVRADVFNSIGLSTCPQDQWEALDEQVIAEEFGADAALLNGIRFWVLDLIQNNSALEAEPVTERFGEIEMRLAASVLLPPGVDPTLREGGGYEVARVDRDTVFHYAAGRQVYELKTSDGVRYMMQSFSQQIDKDQQLADLQLLGERLNLPPGWSFSTRILAEDFALPTIDGVAEVATDDLNNTYQRVP